MNTNHPSGPCTRLALRGECGCYSGSKASCGQDQEQGGQDEEEEEEAASKRSEGTGSLGVGSGLRGDWISGPGGGAAGTAGEMEGLR